MRHLIPALLGMVLISSCDYVDKPLGDDEGPIGPGPGVTVPRRILLEEYTGHQCTYCPEGHAIAHEQEQIYGDQLVIIAMHVGSLADPLEPVDDGYYDTDFHTPDGDAILLQWPASAIPKGMINRIPYNGTMLTGRSAWSPAIFAQSGLDAQLDLWFDTLYLEAGTIHGEFKTAVLNNLSGEHDLVFALVEDSIVDWQLVNGGDPENQPDYLHRHALRGNLNGTWGEQLIQSSATAGDTLARSLTYTLPANVLNSDHCYLVAYAYRTDTYEVMQVVQRKLTP